MKPGLGGGWGWGRGGVEWGMGGVETLNSSNSCGCVHNNYHIMYVHGWIMCFDTWEQLAEHDLSYSRTQLFSRSPSLASGRLSLFYTRLHLAPGYASPWWGGGGGGGGGGGRGGGSKVECKLFILMTRKFEYRCWGFHASREAIGVSLAR